MADRQQQTQHAATPVAQAVHDLSQGEQSELDVLLAKPTALSLAMDPAAMAGMQAMADMMAGAKFSMPEHLRNNPGDCLAIVMQAALWRMSPFAVAQKTHIVGGRLGYEAQLIVAAINTSGILRDRFQVGVFGDWGKILGRFKNVKSEAGKWSQQADWPKEAEEGLGIEVTAWAKGSSKPATTRLLLAQAGTRFSTLWATDPIQQLTYLAQKKWGRVNTPEVLLGVYSDEESANMPEQTKPVDVTSVSSLMRRAVSAEAVAMSDPMHATAAAVDPLEAIRTGLEAVARYGGTSALEKAWKDLTVEQRKQLGEDALKTLKASAAETDKAIAAKAAADAPKPAKNAKPDPETGELKPAASPAAGTTFDEYEEAIKIASGADGAAEHLDMARSQFGADSEATAKLSALYRSKWGSK